MELIDLRHPYLRRNSGLWIGVPEPVASKVFWIVLSPRGSLPRYRLPVARYRKFPPAL
jgi:hypothetical protein